MKKHTLLLLALSFIPSALAADTKDAQQKMNVFTRAIKKMQKKANLYIRCIKKECSQQEQEQVQRELKKAAKIAIPAGIALIGAIVGGVYLYKKRADIVSALMASPEDKKEQNKKLFLQYIQTAVLRGTNDDLETIKMALESGIITAESATEGTVPFFMLAIETGQQKILELFAEHDPAAALGKYFMTKGGFYVNALGAAILYDKPNMALYLLKTYRYKLLSSENATESSYPISLLLSRSPDDPSEVTPGSWGALLIKVGDMISGSLKSIIMNKIIDNETKNKFMNYMMPH